jgi:hypothetical protein
VPERRTGRPDRRASTNDCPGEADDRGCIASAFGGCFSVAICGGQTSRIAGCLTVSFASRESRRGSKPGGRTNLSEAERPRDADGRPEGLDQQPDQYGLRAVG